MNMLRILTIASVLVVIIFVAQNYQVTEVSFLFWSIRASRALVLIFTLVVGFLLGIVTMKSLGPKN